MGIKERWVRFKPLPPDILDRVERLKPLFEQRGILLAYLFGSLATRGQGEDVDLALLPAEQECFEFRLEITDILGTERLDLVNLKKSSPLLRFGIVKNGRLIYRKDDATEFNFVMKVVREYQDTAYLRATQAEILKRRTAEWLSKKS